uniref:Band 4.1-like protein 5 n=1 Tax=Geotrypetes seraphini TaxID=260995 RepID=A0A6P8QR89_GEOSA|nr:band 4.1-like protein 5 [Geotrypetes seraphini]XP_033800858.1 band 4.1-like protein 5 [Geotrypetes seraphini]
MIAGNIQSSPLSSRIQEVQESREATRSISALEDFIPNVLYEGKTTTGPNPSPVPSIPDPAEDAKSLQSTTDELNNLLATLTENLIDFTDTAPQVSSSNSSITPIWKVPSGSILNGFLGNEIALPAKIPNDSPETLPGLSTLLPAQPVPAVKSAVTQISEDPATAKCLLTTEL